MSAYYYYGWMEMDEIDVATSKTMEGKRQGFFSMYTYI
jgi:hypothetical protein